MLLNSLIVLAAFILGWIFGYHNCEQDIIEKGVKQLGVLYKLKHYKFLGEKSGKEKS